MAECVDALKAELAEANTVQKATESNLGVQYDRLEDENRALKADCDDYKFDAEYFFRELEKEQGRHQHAEANLDGWYATALDLYDELEEKEARIAEMLDCCEGCIQCEKHGGGRESGDGLKVRGTTVPQSNSTAAANPAALKRKGAKT